MKKLKYLLTLFVICLGIINFSSASIRLFPIGSFAENPNNSSIDFKVDVDGNFYSENNGVTKKLLWIDQKSYIFWNSIGLPYFVWGDKLQGIVPEYKVCDELIPNGNVTIDFNYNSCTPTDIVNNETTAYNYMGTFLSNLDNNDYRGIEIKSDWNYRLCISSSNLGKSLCFNMNRSTSYYNNISMPYNQGFSSVNDIYLSNAPIYNGSGNGGDGGNEQEIVGIELGSDESGINYFESRYGWNENICYVGVDNMTDLWGSSVSFQEGKGLSIFEAFETLYGNIDLNKVYVWINSRLINYGQWFGRNGDPLYLASYNSGTNQVDLRYENLTFPFINNPVAVYFMSDYMTRNSEYDTMGSEIVSYCNLKINDGTFDEIIDQSTKNNINKYTEQFNKNKGLNPDGTVVNIDFSGLMYTGDAWLSSGVNIAFSGNTTIKNTLENFFGKIEEGLSSFESSSNYKILPDWLIASFLFIVLFKFLRKKK